QLLREAKNPIGVLVNDFGDLQVDAKLIENKDSLTLSLTNGCVCCNLNEDLGSSLEQMKEKDVEAVVIEASGVALPIKLANYGLTWPGYSLSGILSVVQGESLINLLSDKFVSKTVRAQIEQADQILLNRFQDKDKEILSRLNADYITEKEVKSYWDLIFEEITPVNCFTEQELDQHSTFQSSVLSTDKVINRNRLERYLIKNSSIERAKGWIRDEGGKTWLLQMNKSECNFSISSYETNTRLVFIHTQDLDLNSLDPIYS
ncbi:MAG TPA: GTP-binding protein, partial [SAR86 cluster bacterium]|nr:GTP-binding protein [SAR86 cluster bacterium]